MLGSSPFGDCGVHDRSIGMKGSLRIVRFVLIRLLVKKQG